MQKNSQDFSMQEALRLAKSPAGQQLLAFLQQSNSQQLQQAADLAAAGNLDAASRTLSSLTNDPKIRELLKQLGG